MNQVQVYSLNSLQYTSKVGHLVLKYYDATHFVVNTNDVIMNRSCRDMKVGTSNVKCLHKTELGNCHFYVITSYYLKLNISIIDDLGNIILIMSEL